MSIEHSSELFSTIAGTDPELSQILAKMMDNAIHAWLSPSMLSFYITIHAEKRTTQPYNCQKQRAVKLLGSLVNFDFCFLWSKCLIHHTLSHPTLCFCNFRSWPGTIDQSSSLKDNVIQLFALYMPE